MTDYRRDWKWTCAGCGSETRITITIAARTLNASSNPARFIAHERLAMERSAATRHAEAGCKRPV